MKNLLLTLMMLAIFATSSFANQIGVNFTQDNIGILGDYEKRLSDNADLNLDGQMQRGDTTSMIGNASVLMHAAI